MSVLMILATSMISVPQVSEEQTLTIQKAYPLNAIRSEKSAASLIQVVVSPSGKVVSCRTVAVYGDEKLGEQPCKVYADVAFNLPSDVAGKASYGLYTTLVRYVIAGTKQGKQVERITQRPDLSFTVESLPEHTGDEMRFDVLAQISAAGKVEFCEGSEGAPAEYAAVACDSLKKAGWSAINDENGSPVAFVTALKVRFAVEEGSGS